MLAEVLSKELELNPKYCIDYHLLDETSYSSRNMSLALQAHEGNGIKEE